MIKRNKKNILIIGAGMAGLAAANKLNAAGFKTTVLEARDRIGGRIHTNYELGFPLDLGASWIHGSQKNPLIGLAKKYHVPLQAADLYKSFWLLDKQKKLIPCEQVPYLDAEFKELLTKAGELAEHAHQDMSIAEAVNALGPLRSPLKEIYVWRVTLYQAYTGGDLQDLSARYWDHEEILAGGNHLLLQGYQPIVEGLAEGCDIRLNTQVLSVNYQPLGAKIKTTQGDYSAEAVLITVPLSILKSGSIVFNPELPESKQKAIENLQMGLLNKVALKFPSVFWPTNYQIISYCADEYDAIPQFVNYHYFFQQPVLVGFVGATLAKKLEQLTDEDLVQQAVEVLRQLFGAHVPHPVDWCVTHWAKEPFSQGSYSYIPVDASGHDYEIMAEPIDDLIFFAGEATHAKYPATVHGAYLSGIREAERIIKSA